VTNAAINSGDKIAWQWVSGAAFGQGDLGDPSSNTDYTLCVYDSTASVSSLAAMLQIPAASAGWRNYSPRGWTWSDSTGSLDGIKKLQIRAGDAGKTKVKLSAGGTFLPLPLPFSGSAFFAGQPSVVVQLIADEGNCWTSTFEEVGTTSNTSAGFKASGN
jgi:hypothetical protein